MGKNAYSVILRDLILRLFEEKDTWHGYDIMKALREKSNGEIEIKENRLYPALHKLQEEGILKSELVKINNRSRKYYSLTEEGSTEVVQATAKLTEMAKALQLVLKGSSYA